MKKYKIWNTVFIVLVSILMLAACGQKGTETETMADEGVHDVAVTDALGYLVHVRKPDKTAVLSESLADAWLLAGGELAATTEDAAGILEEYPETVSLGALKSPSVETLIAEEIDLVILSAAISEHVKLRDTLVQAGITAIYFDIEVFADYEAMMGIFAEITGHDELYEENVGRPAEIIAEQIKRADGSQPSVLFLRAYSTGVKAKGSDSMTGQMLRELGCVNIADSDKGLLENLSMEAILEKDPDYIFVTTMGSSEQAALDMVEELLISNPAWQGLKAVQSGNYYVLPKDLFHNKPNNRWGESYQILADILYGEE